MTKKTATFFNPDMKTITPDTVFKCTKTDAEVTYLENKNIGEAIRHKLRKKYVYKTDMHKIYNIIMVHTN